MKLKMSPETRKIIEIVLQKVAKAINDKDFNFWVEWFLEGQDPYKEIRAVEALHRASFHPMERKMLRAISLTRVDEEMALNTAIDALGDYWEWRAFQRI